MPASSFPVVEAARAELISALRAVAARPIDVEQLGWDELERSIAGVLRGPFSIEDPEHQHVAMGLAALFADRLAQHVSLFWFSSTTAPGGAEVGFADVLMKLSPFSSVVAALQAGRLSQLDDVAAEARALVQRLPREALTAAAYEQRFDACMVQVVAVDLEKAQQTWALTPEALRALLATNSEPVARQLESMIAPMEPGRSLLQNTARSPRVVELLGVLSGSVAATEFAHENAWLRLAMPLLFIGAPDDFPPLAEPPGVDEEALFLYFEHVPCTFEPPEDGVLGAFPAHALRPFHAAFQDHETSMVGVDVSAVREPLRAFDEGKTRDAIERYARFIGVPVGSAPMLDAALVLLNGLRAVVDTGQPVFLRRLTRSEAEVEPELQQLRRALFGSR